MFLEKHGEFEVKGKKKLGRPKKTWKTQVEKESKSAGLEKEDAWNRARWRDCCQSGVNLVTPVYMEKPRSKLDDDDGGLNTKTPST